MNPVTVVKRSENIPSLALGRSVLVDFYQSVATGNEPMTVLLVNDGQDLAKMKIVPMLSELIGSGSVRPLLVVGIHAGPQRKLEYGTAHAPDYKNRGALAPQYTQFITAELIPFIRHAFPGLSFVNWSFAGFSLGGLSALDICWSHPHIFTHAAVFSGSLWWRSLDQEDPGYSDDRHRLMHSLIRREDYKPGLKFFFECGPADEVEDRNQNGVIDSIDDTKDLIIELMKKGYREDQDIQYLEIPGGAHDTRTWETAMPYFLKWLRRNSLS
ncbi:MAG TPA: alpha/beta hydrolase-fold protein [Puia sp.]|nr:alpha/beta hydrolase-fold protein [Puia sp.]